MSQQVGISLFDFQKHFSTEEACQNTSLTCGGKKASVAHDVATKSTILFQNGDSTMPGLQLLSISYRRNSFS